MALPITRPHRKRTADYGFGRDDSFFPSVVTVARNYSDREPDLRPPESRFREVLRGLRQSAPTGAHVLLDQLEHRWRHPDCPPCLYVLTCTLLAPDRGGLASDGDKVVQELRCTKIGRAKRTLAGRLDAYKKDPLGGLEIAPGTQSLRVVIFGDGSAMLLESEFQKFARSIGSRVEVVEEGVPRFMRSDETYLGVEMVDALCAFAHERA